MIDIVIVNFNSTDYLLECLQSIYADIEGLPAAIWIEDNGSVDGIDRITNQFPDVMLTRNKKNLGFAAAVNQSLKKGNAPYVVLLNPDSRILKGFFNNIIPFMEQNSQVAIAGPRIMDEDGSVQGSARAFPTPLTALFGRSSLFSRIFPNNPITSANILTNRSDGIHPMEVDWVSGACMVIRRKAVHAVGYFDERFFMYWEDADWCKRMWNGGWKVVYYPPANIIHHVGVSSSQHFSKSRFEFHKSVYLLFEKYSPATPWLIKVMVIASLFTRFGLLIMLNGISRCTGIQDACSFTPSQARPDSKKIKILRLIARLNVGGPAIHVHLLTTGLNPEHFESVLVTGMISEKEGDMSYLFQGSVSKPYQLSEMQRDIRIPMDLRVIRRIFQFIRKMQPDIVHTHTAKAGFTARITVLLYNLIFRKNIKIVHTFHGHVFDGYFSRTKSRFFILIERVLARMTDVIIAISETQRRDLAIKYRIAPLKKIREIELGFDLEPFLSSGVSRGRFREKLGVGSKTILVGIIGRLVPIKNHEMFFEAVRRLLDENPQIDVRFVVVGDGECRQYLEAYCRQAHLSDYVVFCGWIQNVSMVYADLNVLALTSLNEGTPVSIIEAMASSVPVIATRVGGIKDLMGSPDNFSAKTSRFMICERGLICPNGDSEGFSMGLDYLFGEDPKIRETRIQRARAYVIKKYAKERLLKDIESLYDQLMKG